MANQKHVYVAPTGHAPRGWCLGCGMPADADVHRVPPPRPDLPAVDAEVFKLTVRWLGGGLEEVTYLSARRPLSLSAVADAVDAVVWGDDQFVKMAAAVRAVDPLHVRGNDAVRFAAVTDTHLVEIEALAVVPVAVELKDRPGDHVVDLSAGGAP